MLALILCIPLHLCLLAHSDNRGGPVDAFKVAMEGDLERVRPLRLANPALHSIRLLVIDVVHHGFQCSCQRHREDPRSPHAFPTAVARDPARAASVIDCDEVMLVSPVSVRVLDLSCTEVLQDKVCCIGRNLVTKYFL